MTASKVDIYIRLGERYMWNGRYWVDEDFCRYYTSIFLKFKRANDHDWLHIQLGFSSQNYQLLWRQREKHHPPNNAGRWWFKWCEMIHKNNFTNTQKCTHTHTHTQWWQIHWVQTMTQNAQTKPRQKYTLSHVRIVQCNWSLYYCPSILLPLFWNRQRS